MIAAIFVHLLWLLPVLCNSYALHPRISPNFHSSRGYISSNSASGLQFSRRLGPTAARRRSAPLQVKKTIWGQNVAQLKPFNLKSPKDFKFLGSFAANVPEYSLPEVVFLGRSNVGKSSFLNSLTGRSKNVAVVSKTPGRTQRINLFEFSSAKAPICIFADLPGYGFAKVAKDKQEEIGTFLKGYLENRGSIRLAMLLVDARRLPMLQSDIDMASYLLNLGLRLIVVATKTDLVSIKDRGSVTSAICKALDMTPSQVIPYSSHTGEGRQQAWTAIRHGLLNNDEYDPDPDAEVLDVGELYE